MGIENTLEERGKVHGNFAKTAEIAQRLKSVIPLHGGKLKDNQIEALEMILHKIARIISGDPNHKDHWHDIAGYATLVERELK